MVIHVRKTIDGNDSESCVYTHIMRLLCEQLSLAVVTIYSYYVGQSYIISQLLKKADSFCYFNAFRLTNDLLM